MQYVFISHANLDKTENREHLRAIVDALTQSGITVWIDNPVNLGYSPDEAGFLRIHAGRPYQDEIDEAHEGADVVLSVWSANVVARFPSGAPQEGHVLRPPWRGSTASFSRNGSLRQENDFGAICAGPLVN